MYEYGDEEGVMVLERQIAYAQNQLIRRQAIIQYWSAHATALAYDVHKDETKETLEKIKRHVDLLEEMCDEINALMKKRDDLRAIILRRNGKSHA